MNINVLQIEHLEGRYDRGALEEQIFSQMIIGDEFFEWSMFPGLWDKVFKKDVILPFLMNTDDRSVVGGDAAIVYPCLLNVQSIYVMKECFYHYRQRTDSVVKRYPDKNTERERFHLLYETVKNRLVQGKDIYNLEEQWRKYALFLMLPRADALYEGFEKLAYLFPFPYVRKGEDIILYGAGTYGQRLYRFLERTGFCRVTAWVDRNYKEFSEMGLPVQSPEVLRELSFDAIVIANTYARSRKGLYQELVQRYPESKVHMIDEDLIFSEETGRAFGITMS